MKHLPDSDPEARWMARLRQARTDLPPPVDRAALLRALRAEPMPGRLGWVLDFAGLFARSSIVPACLGAAATVALVTAWQVWGLWEALPWAQMLGTLNGGGL